MRIPVLLLAGLIAMAPASALAGGRGSHNTRKHPGHHDRIKRDPEQRRRFMHAHPCPSGPDAGSTRRCHGYVVDHIKALKHGGADRPWNMQWQTTADAKAKDRWE